MENIDLRRMLEMDEEEKRHMHFVLHQVLDEKFAKISTPVTTKYTSKMKPVCGHGSNNGYGPYEEDDACAFCKHLQYSHHMPVGKSGWIESSTSWPSLS